MAEWVFEKWVLRRDAKGHVRIIYSDVAALELEEEDWQDVKAVLDAQAEAAPS